MPGHEPIQHFGERLEPDPRLAEMRAEVVELQRAAEAGFPPDELTQRGPHVDAEEQALVWAMTASGHAAEALTALTALEDIAAREATGRDIISHAEKAAHRRQADYHSAAHAIADKTAGTWALVASVQPMEDVVVTRPDESPQEGKRGTDA